jgi:hypothetical protein
MWLSTGLSYVRRGVFASSRGDGTFTEPKLGWKEDGRWWYLERPYDFNRDGMFDALAWIEVPYREHSLAISAIGLGGQGPDGSYFRFVEWTPRAPLDGASDLDADGDTDLFHSYVGPCGWSVITALCAGDGTFGELTKHRIGFVSLPTDQTVTSSTIAADASGDGLPDLIQFMQATPFEGGDASLAVTINEGDGNWSPPIETAVPTGTLTAPPSFADVDGNGTSDALLIDVKGGETRVVTVLSAGDGSFALPTVWTAQAAMNCGAWDLNGDGRVDLLCNGSAGRSIVAGRGDGTFVPLGAPPSDGRGSPAPQTADVNGDGKLDVIFVGYSLFTDSGKLLVSLAE